MDNFLPVIKASGYGIDLKLELQYNRFTEDYTAYLGEEPVGHTEKYEEAIEILECLMTAFAALGYQLDAVE